jgi:hypothetical protein
MGAVLLETLALADGEHDISDVLRLLWRRPTTFQVRAQVRSGLHEPESSPHLFVESSADGEEWTSLADGLVNPGMVAIYETAYDPAASWRLRWVLDELGMSSWWLRAWTGSPAVAFR